MDLDDLLKSIREEGEPNKGGVIVPAKFFGEDRYDKIYQELLAEGKIEGDNLSPEERKQGVRAYRKSKIDFEKFVNQVLQTKREVSFGGGGTPTTSPSRRVVTSNQKLLPGAPSISDLKPPQAEPEVEIEDDLEDIDKKLDDLLKEVRKGNKEEKKSTEKQRKKKERERRSERENKREKVKNFLVKPIEKALAPIQNFFDKIIGGLVKILLAKALIKFIDWFADPDNEEKVNAIGRFLKDFWPGIIGGLLLIGTGLGSFGLKLLTGGAKLIGSLLKMTLKLGMIGSRLALKGGKGLLKLAAANPVTSALVVGGAVAAGGAIVASQRNEQQREEDKKTDPSIVTPKDTKETGKTPSASQLMKESSLQRGFTAFSGGGKAKARGTDIVPAMLTPGEFIMSKGAVDTFGVDFMESINAAGGGTNLPQKIGGTFYAQGGGSTRRKPKSMTDGEVDTAKGTTQKQGEGGSSAVISAGKMLLGKGFTVAEHKNFRKNSYSGSGANTGIGFNPSGGERIGGHSSRSLHYKNLAVDVTDWRPGDWKGRTFSLAETMYQNREKLKLTQIIHDPWGSWFAGGGKGGAIGGHDTHLHLGFASGPSDGADLGDFIVPSGGESYAGGGGGGGASSTAAAITPMSPILVAAYERARLEQAAGQRGFVPVPVGGSTQQPQGASNDTPQLGSVDPLNSTLFVMRSMYNLGG